MSKYSPSNYVGKPIICTKPCAEVPLEDGGACNLGSINLSRFVKNGNDERSKLRVMSSKLINLFCRLILSNKIKEVVFGEVA